MCGCGGEEEVEGVECGGGAGGELAVAGGVDGDLEGVCVFFWLVGWLGELLWWMDGWTYLLRGEYRAVEHR